MSGLLKEFVEPLTLAVFFAAVLLGGALVYIDQKPAEVSDSAEVFARLYTNCRLYVEEYSDFDTTGLNEGAINATKT